MSTSLLNCVVIDRTKRRSIYEYIKQIRDILTLEELRDTLQCKNCGATREYVPCEYCS